MSTNYTERLDILIAICGAQIEYIQNEVYLKNIVRG